MCSMKIFKAPVQFIDVFGNHVFAEPSTQNLSDKRFAIKPLNPLHFSTTYFYSKSISQNSVFSTNLAMFNLRILEQPLELYLDYVFETYSLDKFPSLITYFEGGQFWGESSLNIPLEGKFYTNEQDYSTVSEKEVYEGQFSVTSKNFRYEGYLQHGVPHYYGSYYLNNSLIYTGEIIQGVPDGKGEVFDENGSLVFSGTMIEGLPYYGVYYKLPRIFKGKFIIAHKSKYKFVYKKLDMFIKSLRYDLILQSFTLDGEIHNYSSDVKVINGRFSYDQPMLTGEFYLCSREGKIYIGEMNGSKKEGVGLLLLNTGVSLVGIWRNNTFRGMYKNPARKQRKASDGQMVESDHIKREGMAASRNVDSNSRYESVKRTSGFNKEPVEVKGFFVINGNDMKLIDYGIIKFEDGSEYRGGMSENKMSGFGSMRFSTGEYYEGMWRNNQMNGVGVYSGDNFTFEGQFKAGLWHGFGILWLKAEKRFVKGEWDKGKLKYALVDEVPSNNNYLQVERMIVSVTEESEFFKTGRLELVGTTQVIFKDKWKKFELTNNNNFGGRVSHQGVDSDHVRTFSQHQSQDYGSRAGNQEANVPPVSPNTIHHSPSQKSKGIMQFFGEFVRFEEEQSSSFGKGEIVGIGYILKDGDLVFKGMVDVDFSNFFGIKYDYEESKEYKGRFTGNFKMNGIGTMKSEGYSYRGMFRKNLKNGIIIKYSSTQEIHISEYFEDKKHGYCLKKDTEQNILTEYSYGKLKRVFFDN